MAEYLQDDVFLKMWCPTTTQWYKYSDKSWQCHCQSGQASQRISIITAVKDREHEFVDAVSSLSKQIISSLEKQNITVEHVIQDGGGPSRVKIIESHSKFHTILSTSPDFGLYSGFNMGLKLASGNYIGFLNSDDMYEKFFLEKSITHLNASGCDWVFGNIIIKQNKANYYIPGKVDYFMKPWMNFSRFHHNTVLARREIFEKIGHFPETLMGRKLKYCADYWWFIRAQQSGFIGVYCPDLIGFMQDGGASSGSKKEIYQEAAFVAQTLYPSKTLQIRIIWLLRFIDNEYLSRFNMGLVRKFRSIGRKIYGLIAGYAFNFRVEAGTKR